MRGTIMIGKCTVFLQNCPHFLEAAPGLCSDTSLIPDVDVKVEVSGIKEEEDPLLIVPAVKADDEVSCLYVCLSVCVSVCLSVYLSSHPPPQPPSPQFSLWRLSF
jgi:hypothetical protein